MARLKASEVAEKVAHDAIQTHGSYGYSQEYPVERVYRDQRLMSHWRGHQPDPAPGHRLSRPARDGLAAAHRDFNWTALPSQVESKLYLQTP
jgi:hypothetical protein